MKFGFVAKYRAIWPLELTCEALGVSRSGSYSLLTREPSARSVSDAVIGLDVRTRQRKTRLMPEAGAHSFRSLDSGYGFWGLFLAGGTNNVVYAQQTGGNPLLMSGATPTAHGFDFTVPLTPTGAVFQYNFTVDAYGYVTGYATGNTTETGSISAMLAGIDWVDGSGATVGSAMFDERGFGTVGLSPVGPPSTVPEPGSMALLGTGLVALIPAARRRTNR